MQAHDPDLGLRKAGAWLNPTIPSRDLSEQMQAVAELIDTPGATIRVTATVGFHQLELPEQATVHELTTYSRGVADYGEPYALFARHLNRPVSEDTFATWYEGSYASVPELIASRAQFTLDIIQDDAQKKSDTQRKSTIDTFERALRRHYLLLEGRDAVHVFHRANGPSTEVR